MCERKAHALGLSFLRLASPILRQPKGATVRRLSLPRSRLAEEGEGGEEKKKD